MAGSVRSGWLEWTRPRRLRLSDLPERERRLATLGVVLAAGSAAVVLAVGFGWNPPGGTHQAAFGDLVPRFLVPWSCLVLGALAALFVLSLESWKHPRVVRVAIGLAGGALAGLMLSVLWVVDSVGYSATVRPAVWVAFAAAGAVAAMNAAWVARHPGIVAVLAAVPFAVTLGAWALAPTDVVALPDGMVSRVRDVLAQPVITITLSLVAAAGITVLWSIALSPRQARDMAAAVVDGTGGGVLLTGVLLAAKVLALVAAYPGWFDWHQVGFAESRSDTIVAWGAALGFAAAAGWWLLRSRAAVPGEDGLARVVRPIGLGFSAVFLASVVLALVAGVVIVLPSTGPASAANRVIGWLLSTEPPVAIWAAVATTLAVAVVALFRWRRGSGLAGVTAVFALWMVPRAVQTALLVLREESIIDAPSVSTMDTVVTAGLVLLWFGWRGGRQRRLPPSTLMLLLIGSTLLAHPFRLLPSDWRSGSLFYFLLVYPLLWRWLFDSASLNEQTAGRTGRVMQSVSLTALLMAANSMLVVLGIVTPESTSMEKVLLGSLAATYLLAPVAALVFAGEARRREGSTDEGAQALASTDSDGLRR